MKTIQNRLASLTITSLVLTLATGVLLAAEPDKRAWLENWQKQNPKWRALHLIGPRPELLPVTKQLVGEVNQSADAITQLGGS